MRGVLNVLVSLLNKGTVLRDGRIPDPWNLLIVYEVGDKRFKAKRPYTHPSKTFVLFEDIVCSFESDNLPPDLSVERD